jgi:rhodanese-related sulfurtransferase
MMIKKIRGQTMKKMMIYTALVLAAALAFTGCAPNSSPNASVSPSAPSETAAKPSEETAVAVAGQLISVADAKALIGTAGVTLLDVRTQEEYDEAHIDGAVLLPYDSITPSSVGLPADKNATVIVYCRSGRRSAIAAETLIGLGYTKVYDLGGIQSWPYETVS